MAAVLPSPRAAPPGGTLSSPTSAASPSRSSKSQRLSAAADLIRNLDAALTGMTTAANSAAEDAARARRNAKAAGEVARRYGGSAKKKKKRGEKDARASTSEGMLERKRERRAAARMAAEARQRREHPMMGAVSPRRNLTSPRGARGGTFLFAAEDGGKVPENVVAQDNHAANADAPSAGQLARAEATKPVEIADTTPVAPSAVVNEGPVRHVQEYPEIRTVGIEIQQQQHQAHIPEPSQYQGHPVETEAAQQMMDQPQPYYGQSVDQPAETTEQLQQPYYGHSVDHVDASAAPGIPAVRTDGSLASGSLTDFEDAMEHHHDDYTVESKDAMTGAVDGMVAEEQAEIPEGGGPPTDGGYYAQQQSYYDQQQMQQQQAYYQSEQAADQGQQQDYASQGGQQQNAEYYNYNQTGQGGYQYNSYDQQQVYAEQPMQQQPAPELAVAASTPTAANTAPKQSPKPPRSQPTSTTRIEASHAEDVLSLSLELERLRSQLATTTSQLETATIQVATLQSQNDHLQAEVSTLHSQLETHNERSSSQLATAEQQLETELIRSKAAEEDAALALELAKEAQNAREECELWLSRSLEEIDLWKGRCGELESKLKEQEKKNDEGTEDEGGEEPRKSVRFKDDCPPSPVVSEDGGVEASPNLTSAPIPPPPPPPEVLSTPQGVKLNGSAIGGINIGIFSPSANGIHGTPTKSEAVASGRAFLHRASPSPLKGSLSPHPLAGASELMKKSAETRRLLREKLNATPSGHIHHRPPVAAPAGIPRASSDPNLKDTFASRQGAACKAVGRTIKESGARLRLEGSWWVSDKSASPLITNGGSSVEEGTVAQLESMVRDYCGGVEGTIGKQKERIDELLAFCDHLEREVMLSAKG